MKTVAVASCAQYAWLDSSYTMGRYLANAIGEGAVLHVHTPIDQSGLLACFEDANALIVHTHGTPDALVDQRGDQKQPMIASLGDIMNFPVFSQLEFVFMTACETAGGNCGQNLASVLSTRIAENGLVIANRYIVYGADHDFGEQSGKLGWVGYQNGALVLTENAFPAMLTPEGAYEIYMRFRNRWV